MTVTDPNTEFVECIVVGAGVVGLAVARALSLAGLDVLLLEAEAEVGTQTSARNSEVIHAGIYYPSDSEKAALCLPGKHQLYDYCASRGLPHSRCGKLIVATNDAQLPELEAILAAGRENGVDDLLLLSGGEVNNRSTELKAEGAIWSPSSGIVDSHQLMLSLLADFENAGGTLAVKTIVFGVDVNPNGITVRAASGSEIVSLRSKVMVNSAGIGAIPLAKKMNGLPLGAIPDIKFAKGSYFSYTGSHSFDCLVYPVPTPGGLGTHLTLDMAGQARFGPDVEWVEDENYHVSPAKLDEFYEAVRDYWPGVVKERLSPAYAGIRAKCAPAGKSYTDFIFSGPETHGVSGLVNLFGMESPGLTSCLAIADRVKSILNL